MATVTVARYASNLGVLHMQYERNNLSEQELRDLSRKRAAVTMLSRSGYVAPNNNGNVQLPDGGTTLPYTWKES